MSRRDRGNPWPLRRHLGVLLWATGLPLLLFTGVVVARLTSEMRADVEHRLLGSARAMTATLDHEVAATVGALEALARSTTLDRADLAAFREEATLALRMHSSWLTVILVNTQGQQVLNVLTPPESSAQPITDPSSFQRVLDARAPTVGALKQGRRDRSWGFAVRVPVVRDGGVRYVLTAVIPARAMAGLMAHPEGPDSGDELTRTLVDSDGNVVFRGRSPERFVGVRATDDFRLKTREHLEGVFRSVTLEGLPSYVAYSRSRSHGWVSAVAVPRALIDGPMRRSLGALGLFAAVALIISGAGAIVLTSRFRRGMGELERAGRLLAEGEWPRMEPSGIRELDLLAESLTASATLLRERGRERDEHLERAEAAVRARDEFLSLASHELKTPLTSLVLHARILQKTLSTEESMVRAEAGRFANQAIKQTARLGRLINDMLDISRVAAGRLSIQREEIDLSALAYETVGRLHPVTSEAGCEVTVRAPEPVRGSWDPFRMDQVLDNLLVNAARYGAGTPIEVTVRHLGDSAELSVRDFGRGIAPEDLERVFRKFERAVERSDVSGLGIGLYIVREIVQMHGGTVKAHSEEGRGATFTVTLPLTDARASTAASA